MISNSSKRELKRSIGEMSARLEVLKSEEKILEDKLDFVRSRKLSLKTMIDDLKTDSE